MSHRFRLVVDRFHPEGAKRLRAEFDGRLADPRRALGERFVWDWWHVPDQYTHLRTPAWEFFPRRDYQALHRALVLWGRRTLGCWDVSPPWLSCYVEGCEQKLHADVPHGPWAFVYALTPPGRPRFTGGETLLLRPETLDYWRGFQGRADRELSSFIDRIPSRFDRLVVFDPRLPHGVTRVSGTLDPREGRLVVHGWFTEPKPFLEGGLSARKAEGPIDEAVAGLGASLAELGALHGVLALRLDVAPAGDVRGVTTLASTLVRTDAPGQGEALAARRVTAALRRARFPRASAPTRITLPLLFS